MTSQKQTFIHGFTIIGKHSRPNWNCFVWKLFFKQYLILCNLSWFVWSLTACWWAQNYETEHNELSSPVTLVELFLLCVCVLKSKHEPADTAVLYVSPSLQSHWATYILKTLQVCSSDQNEDSVQKCILFDPGILSTYIARDDLAMKLHQPWHPSLYWLMTTLLREFLLQMRVSMNITTPAMLLWLVKNLLMTSDYSWMWTSGCWQVLQLYGCFRQRSQFVFLELGFQCFFIF